MFKRNYSQATLRGAWILLNLTLALSLFISGCGIVDQPKIYRVGILSGLSAFTAAVDGFKAKMTELGYIEGENIVYDVQSSEVDIEAYRSISKKFVEDQVDLIFALPTEASMEAKAAAQGSDIPIVFALAFTDVDGINLIESIREPGSNITGVRFPSAEFASKRLEILLQIAPNAKRIFVPYLEGYPNVPGQLDAIRPQAEASGIELIIFPASEPEELQAETDRLAALEDNGVDAILILAEPLAVIPPFFTILGKFSYDHKIPMGGTLISMEGYETIFGLAPNTYRAGEESALLADKILQGAPAGTIPVVTPNSYFQINYKAAQNLGITIPEGLLKQADEIIR
ncbi:MAG: ABC transporter substrate-binding protein [Anaerolineales bacterium]|nr:ABC transporter substrate-binding protein [Anaerolineales bacterium]